MHALHSSHCFIPSTLSRLNAHFLKVHEENERAEIHEETSIAGCSSNPRDDLTVKEIDDVLISPYEDNEAFRITTPLSTIDSGNSFPIPLKFIFFVADFQCSITIVVDYLKNILVSLVVKLMIGALNLNSCS